MRLRRPTYPEVVSSLAMFIALGGTSYAVATLPRNSVGSTQVKDHSLRAVDLARDAVAAGPRGPRGPEGPAGTTGPAGAAGAPGPAGSAGVTSVVMRRRDGSAIVDFNAGASVDVATMKVPAGRWLVQAETTATYFPNQSPNGDQFHCGLITDGVLTGHKQAFLGNATGATHEMTFTVTQPLLDSASSASVVLRCWHDSILPSGASVANFAHTVLWAAATRDLDVQNVTG